MSFQLIKYNNKKKSTQFWNFSLWNIQNTETMDNLFSKGPADPIFLWIIKQLKKKSL